ncbi:MAG: hypothetical protein JNM41_05540 [Flavipsychrobacter sp.]|nr:hypothetical protein [Flavipsychrobacter sp.]
MKFRTTGYVSVFVAFCALAFFMSGCGKQKQNSAAGQWRCSGTGVDHYYYDTMVRVWTGVDSQWLSTYSFGDSNLVIADKILEIKEQGNSRLVITSLANDVPWSNLKTDTLSLVGVQGAVSQYIVTHRLPSNENYTIDLVFDGSTGNIHVKYLWTTEGPLTHDIGGNITLNGVRN